MISNTKVKRINNTKTNNTTKKINSKLESLKVSYPDTLLQSIKNTQDLTQYSNIYKNAPQITILNAKPKLYLITMTDPDAPYGMSNNNTSNAKNHTYTHWIFLQDIRKKSNTNKSTNTTKTLFTYAPPSPPYGIHRYQFKLYDVTNVSPITLDTIKKNINNSQDRNIDYISNKTLKPIAEFQYKVNSGKSPTITTTTLI